MNIILMIISTTVVCTTMILLCLCNIYRTRIRVKQFIKTTTPKVKSATTISELLYLDDVVSKFALVNNSFKLKSIIYWEVKMLLVSINAKIELLDKI